MPYHAEHHACTGVPFHALPLLHERVADRLGVTQSGYVAFQRTYLRELGKKRLWQAKRVRLSAIVETSDALRRGVPSPGRPRAVRKHDVRWQRHRDGHSSGICARHGTVRGRGSASRSVTSL